jgi:ATP-dependent helicase HrpB
MRMLGMIRLPVDLIVPSLIESLRHHRSAIVVAPPGTGKTTRIPPAILASGLLHSDRPNLLLLQPRRIAARAAAMRIAEERGWSVGGEVGWIVRFESRVGPGTRLKVLTEGVLNRLIIDDPLLQGVGAVVIDEFHERSVHTDLAVAMLREIRESLREDLILIVMSATIDAQPLARYLRDAPILEVAAQPHAVEVIHRPVPSGKTCDPTSIVTTIEEVIAADRADEVAGHILVFLPGLPEIRRVARALEPIACREGLLVLPLHGSLSAEEQDRALRPSSRRKLILATNVAETSLTIDGVSTVIDTGLARFASHDAARGIDRLELGKISRASATQRAGRAGRTGPGRCIRLWSERDHAARAAFDTPEIRRIDLSSTLLAIHAWGCSDPARFEWFEPPPAEAIAAGESLLQQLGALASGRITPLGKRMLQIPVHPRLARLVVDGAQAGLLKEAAGLAALLSEKDVLVRDLGIASTLPGRLSPTHHGRSDLLERLEILHEAQAGGFSPALRARGIDTSAARRVAQLRDSLMRSARRAASPAAKPPAESVDETLLQLLLSIYPDRVARRRAVDPTRATLAGGRGLRLSSTSVVRAAPYFLAIELQDDRRSPRGAGEALVHLASAIEPEWLERFFPSEIHERTEVHFDAARGRALETHTRDYRDLPLREESQPLRDPAGASDALAAHLASEAESFVRGDEAAASLLDRILCLRDWCHEHGWPSLDHAALGEIVADACAGRETVDQVRRVPLAPLIRARLSFEQSQALDRLAPEWLVLPSGSRARLRYEPGRPPILAARLQELFGWTEAPRLGGGRVRVLIHLLGPNFRPVQITDDLGSFWRTTYNQVRKDLRNRYPKHAWPEDPMTAKAEVKGARRAR